MTQTFDGNYSVQKTRKIRSQVANILTKRGLLPRFKRWRLTQDPGTGMIILFGILNNKYIAAHTSIPFSDYFDPRILHDLANELQVQVVSCNNDGLRYAFILDRGRLGKLPTHIDFPYIDQGKLVMRVVYDKIPRPASAPPLDEAPVDDRALVHEGVGAFIKVFDDIKFRNDVASPTQLPEVVVIEKNEFDKRVAEHEVDRSKINDIRKLLDKADE